MNLALHGFLLQFFVLILDFQYGFRLCSAGEPGYLDFDNLPETNFSCQGKVIGGYYADVEAGCQMFHVCTIGQKDEIMDIKFLCLNGTVFDQETRVCERVDEVDCSKSERFYNLNLELYGNNAVTLSLHENSEGDDDRSEAIEDHQQHSTSARPASTSTTSTTTSRPSQPSTTASSGSFQHSTGYPQHYQPQPTFPQVHTSQSKSLYDDKNGGYHHQYIFHNGERNDNQATSFQLFSNQGVSSTTAQPPQVHQVRFSSTSGPQIIHNEPSTVSPLFHSSSTIQTLLNNANGPALINPIFHNHGIVSTTEQYTVHSSNPRETSEYEDEEEQEENIRTLEAVQSTNQGKISKLTISPVPSQSTQTKSNRNPQQQRITVGFLPTPSTIETTIRSFYPTPRTSSKSSSSSSTSNQVTHHIHVPPPPPIPQLKPQQITINLPPPDLQRLIQNPPPLLPSQSRVIVTAKASISDESGRPLNTTQIVTLPLPTLPSSYDDYKEGDESFDPFYRDVPKIHNNRRIVKSTSESTRTERRRRFVEKGSDFMRNFVYGSKFRSLVPASIRGASGNGRIRRSLSDKHDSRTHIVFGADDESEAFHLSDIDSDMSEEKSEGVGNVETKVLDLPDTGFDGKSSHNYTREVLESVQDLMIKASRYRRVYDDEDSDEDESKEEQSQNESDEIKEDADDNNKSAPLEVDEDEDDSNTPAANTEIPLTEEDSELRGNPISANDEEHSPIPSAKKSDTKKYVLPDISTEKSDFEVNKEYISSLNTKESDAAEYIEIDESERKSNNSDEKSYVSALNTKESDAEEYIQTEETESSLNSEKNAKHIPTANTKESDAEEYVQTEETESTLNSEKNARYIPTANTKESDAEEYIETEETESSLNSEKNAKYISAANTKESDAEEYIQTEETESALNPEKNAKYITAANTKESDAEEYVTSKELDKNLGSKKGNQHILGNKTLPSSGEKTLDSEESEKSEDPDVPIEPIAEEEDAENRKTSNLKNTSRKSGNGRKLEKSESRDSDSESLEERKSDSRKKGRPRSSRRRSSARRKSHKEHSTEDETIDPKTGRKISTTTLSILHSESETERRIDGQILEEPESQTRKELGTRAVAHSDVKGLKAHRKNSGIEIEKSVFKNRFNTLDTAKGSRTNVKKAEETSQEMHHEHEEKEEDLRVDSKEKDKLQNIGESLEDTDSLEEEENSTEVGKQSPENEKSDGHIRTVEESGSLEYVSKEVLTSVREKNKKYESSEESENLPTTQSSEQIFSDELLSDYPYSHEKSYEDSRESSIEEDYKESLSPEDVMTSTEYIGSEEVTDSSEMINESNEFTANDENDSTEGVLKFTDELPNTDEEEGTQERDEEHSDSSDTSEDYVDDNYEPDNYKEHASSIEPENSTEEKVKEDLLNDKKLNATDSDLKELVTSQKDEDEVKEKLKDDDKSIIVGSDKGDIPETMTTTTTTTTTSTSTTTTSTTSTTSTTTPPPTPPKLFRPISMRKTYSYIPPTTTPNPVIIKPRVSLLNPKPAKPPKSYNELAPKPVIRKLPLLTRKSTTTASTTTTDQEVASESSTLDFITTTELVKDEINTFVKKSHIDEMRGDLANHSSDKVTTTIKDVNEEITQSSQEKTSITENNEEITRNVNTENFTPYPLLRLASITEVDEKIVEDSGQEESRIQDTTIESMIFTTKMTNAEETITTTLRTSSLMDRDESHDKSDSTTTDTHVEDTSSKFESTTSSSIDLTDVTLSVLSEISPSISKSSTLLDVVSTTPASVTTILITSTESGHEGTSTRSPEILPTIKKSADVSEEPKVTTIAASNEDSNLKTVELSTNADSLSVTVPISESTTTKVEVLGDLESTKSIPARPLNLKGFKQRRHGGFNCLEKEMYRFYGDTRDCRLFHYCSPGFTSRQVLDFRFVCEEGTAFDEETQSCRHDVPNRKCPYKRW